MKKLLLSLGVVLGTSSLFGQVILSIESPASIVGFPDFTSNGDGSNWATTTLVGFPVLKDTVAIMNDGSAGLNAQGLPISLHGCDSANVNNLTGKFALIYRNTCGFGEKARNAVAKGAIGIIIVNREEALINMDGGAEGADSTWMVGIPVAFVKKSTGDLIRTTIENGEVVEVLIGDKTGLYPHDLSVFDNTVLRPNFGSLPRVLATNPTTNPISFGGRVYNFGNDTMNNVTVDVVVERDGTEVYSETTTPVILTPGDSISNIVVPTMPQASFSTIGSYKITYTVNSTETDLYAGDNVATAEFSITNNVWSGARSSTNDSIFSDGFYSYATSNTPALTDRFTLCQTFSHENASDFSVVGLKVSGVQKALADSIAYEYDADLINWSLYEWAGTGGVYTITANSTIAAASLVPVASGEIALDNYTDGAHFEIPITEVEVPLIDNQKYLACLVLNEHRLTFPLSTSDYYDFNFDDDLVRFPIQVDNTWSPRGFGNAPSFGLVHGHASLNETEKVNGSAYPNPASEIVRFKLEKSGNAVLNITDMSGRTIANKSINVENGQFMFSVAELNNGSYIFNVTFDDNSVSRINLAVAK